MTAVLTGIATAIVVLAGLFLGVWILINTVSQPEMEKPKRSARLAVGILILMAQFAGALAILYYSPDTREHPLQVGGGLIGVIMLVTLYVAYLRPTKK